jgi:hypothetical protein
MPAPTSGNAAPSAAPAPSASAPVPDASVDAGSDGDVDAGHDAGGPPKGECENDSDCVAGRVCSFKIADGCNAPGTCIEQPVPNPANCSVTKLACDCYGGAIVLGCNGYPDGLASQRLAHAGVCGSDGGAGTDAGVRTHTFSCGSSRCTAPTQYCMNSQPIGSFPTYECDDVPKECQGLNACSCIEQAVGGQNCTQNNGEITLMAQ